MDEGIHRPPDRAELLQQEGGIHRERHLGTYGPQGDEGNAGGLQEPGVRRACCDHQVSNERCQQGAA